MLSIDERETLTRWSRRAKSSQALALRCRIVLACAEPGSGVAKVAAELGSTRMTVRKWRRRFAEEGLAGLADHDRPGQKNLLVRVVLRDLEETLTSEDANALRDRIYAAVHQGAEHQWAGRR